MPEARIVADGRKRILESKRYAELRRQVIRRVHAQYEPRLRKAGPMKRFLLGMKRWLEIRRELDKLAPKRGCRETGTDTELRLPPRPAN